MSQLNEKMTALADAIRAKSGMTDKLTIDGMKAAVTNLSIGSGIDTTDATATSGDILYNKIAYAKGQKIIGTIKSVEPTVKDHIFEIDKGYVELPWAISVDVANPPQVKDNVVTIYKGYHLDQKEITVGTAVDGGHFTPISGESSILLAPKGSYLKGDIRILGSGQFKASNIRAGITMWDVEGTFSSDATAEKNDIIRGKTAYVNGLKVTGNLNYPDKSVIQHGYLLYHDEGGYGVYGEFTGDATALSTDILPGKSAYVCGAKIEGSMPAKSAETYTPGTNDITIKSGVYLAEDQTIKGDSDLTASNIRSGVSIFNVSGTFTSDATATASDIASGKTAYVKGVKVTGTSEGGETFYKCTAVFGPSSITFLTVTGAGADCNGRYDDSGVKKNGNPVYQFTNTSGQQWYIYYFEDEYEGNYWLLCDNLNVGYPYGAHYFSSNLTSGWQNGEYGEGSSPTVTRWKETINADQPKTWSGRKVVLSDGVYTFEETDTGGLPYGTAFTPVINKIYNAVATIQVTKLWDGMVIPTDGLLLYVPLDSTPLTTRTGQVIELKGEQSVSSGSLSGIKYCSFSSTYAEVTPVTGFPTGDDERTVSAWVYATDVNTRQTIFCHGTNGRNQTWSFELRAGKISVSGGADGANEGYSIGNVPANGWHHLAVVHRDSTDHFYLDGEGIGSFAYARATGNDLCHIGAGSDTMQLLRSDTYVAALRFYNRALSDDELGALASEFTL